MIDTAAKRFSMLAFGRRGLSLPVADGSFDAFERMHLLGGYFQTPVVVEVRGPFVWEAMDCFAPGFVEASDFAPGFEEHDDYAGSV